jgi:nucleotide-binding universal stress UspA family protein
VTLVAGVPLDGRSDVALQLAELLARSAGDEVVLCTVVREPWPPSPARVDAEYRAELDETASRVLEEAREQMPADVPVRTVVHNARSTSAGLLEVAEREAATAIVVGSSSAGAFGRVALGSVSGRLMHSSPVPVALPPRGFRCQPTDRVRRVTAAYGGTEDADLLVVAAAEVAAQVGATFRIASFAVRTRPALTSGVGTSPEATMVEQWSDEIESAGRAALERVSHLPDVPGKLDAVIGYGQRWEEALEDVEWDDGDVLVVGSSSTGPVAQVFLGSHASKIVRNSPVPVVVVPGGTVAAIAEQAEAERPTSSS